MNNTIGTKKAQQAFIPQEDSEDDSEYTQDFEAISMSK